MDEMERRMMIAFIEARLNNGLRNGRVTSGMAESLRTGRILHKDPLLEDALFLDDRQRLHAMEFPEYLHQGFVPF
jgi:hypothetical protein